MKIEDVIRKKGADVVTIAPSATVAELVELLARFNIGAVVVSADGGIDGIVSERDIVRHLASEGAGVLFRNAPGAADGPGNGGIAGSTDGEEKAAIVHGTGSDGKQPG